jgi:hypothetical protein
MEARNDVVHSPGDDGGEVSYRIAGNEGPEFQIAYDGKPVLQDPTVSVTLTSVNTVNNRAGTKLQLQWGHDNNSPFFISSPKTSKTPATSLIASNNPPIDWINSIYKQISCLTLREFVMPGSHDAGMSEFNQGAGAASSINTVTQKLSIAKQLEFGSRYFDIRPVISGGKVKTGHYGYSKILGIGAWRGGNGQDLDQIVKEINAFTANNKELIILDVTHGLDTDNWGPEDNSRMSRAQWTQALNVLKNLNSRIVIADNDDITTIPIGKFKDGRPAVLIRISDTYKEGGDVEVKGYPGMMTGKKFPLENHYANTNNQNDMINDQLKKLYKYKTKPSDNMFVMSWTLTQGGLSIVDNAVAVNKALPELLWPNLTPNTYPNILFVDAYPSNRDIASLAMAINLYQAKSCPT